MELLLLRHNSGKHSTVGTLSDLRTHKFLGYTCEDEYRAVKVSRETRIPQGCYNIRLNTTGGMNKRYKEIYGDMHQGMLELENVVGFTHIYMHTGNTEAHTDGCILVGFDSSTDAYYGGGEVGRSRSCYRMLYAEISRRLLNDERVSIWIVDSLKELLVDEAHIG